MNSPSIASTGRDSAPPDKRETSADLDAIRESVGLRLSSEDKRELTALRELSACLGSNPLLTQASAGNISVKTNGSLWIKASGKWLIHAATDNFLIEVELERARTCVRENTAIPETKSTTAKSVSASVETAMHAVLPQRVVVHIHSVNTIAWAVRLDAPEQLAVRLAGLRWQWIPYVPSGNSLANAISDQLSRKPQADVLLLGNHGLVICGDSCSSAEQLLAEVERRLAIEPRPAPVLDLDDLAEKFRGPDWFIPQSTEIHYLATDKASRQILSGGVLYPCQAIFFPGAFSAISSDTCEAVANSPEQHMFRLVNNQGVVCNRKITLAEQEMLLGVANVVRRIPECAPIRYLSSNEIEDVLQAEAAAYRQAANANAQMPKLDAHNSFAVLSS